MKGYPTLRTKRLFLRPFTLLDAKRVQELAGDEAIASTTLNIPHPYEDGMAERWIDTHQVSFENDEMIHFAIELESTGMLIGAIGLVLDLKHARAELGYWIGKPYWGQGYCTEAAEAIVQFGFATLGLNRIHASHLSRNPASGRVMQKIGMVHEGHQRKHVLKWDIYEDLELYGLLKTEYAKRAGFDSSVS
jgi:ribosomal-protein-alanine N-acetyltransferase